MDPARSRLSFEALDSGQPWTGKFQRWTAAVDFDPDHLATSSIDIVVDIASADAADELRNGYIFQSEWFDLDRFPQAHFVSKDVRRRADGGYEAAGALTIRNLRRDIVLPFTVEIAGGIAHAKGEVALLRKNFGLGLDTDDDRASLAVNLVFEIFARSSRK